jgi:hypothetical protein
VPVLGFQGRSQVGTGADGVDPDAGFPGRFHRAVDVGVVVRLAETAQVKWGGGGP